ncbi:MAG TPA: hypothetical protein VGQ46_19165 [Thermoanaerobaculia bacterium]|jgi:hypothetical protein|nr:hypothetical protein [Thermoanaerobaculia bacterium]
MDSNPRNSVVRRSRRPALVASILVAGVLVAGQAWADITVNIMNCAQATMKVDAYDSKDSVRVTPASSKTLKSGESGTLHCAGEGKGYCQVQFTPANNQDRCYGSSPGTKGEHVDSGKWGLVKGVEVTMSCWPIITQVDTAPSSDDCTRMGIDNE